MSHTDKRSVHTDALETLGTVIGPNEARDAIHLAVEPVIAGEWLEPGTLIRLDGKRAYMAYPENSVGIVDPFLAEGVYEGQWFWLVIKPRMITSLRHVWTHPDFDSVCDLPVKTKATDTKSKARRWIEDYAERLGGYPGEITADELIAHATTWVQPSGWGGDYLVKGGLLEGVRTDPDFWVYFEALTGARPDDNSNFFSCSC